MSDQKKDYTPMTSEELDAWLVENKKRMRPLPETHWSVKERKRKHKEAMARAWKALAKKQLAVIIEMEQAIHTLKKEVAKLKKRPRSRKVKK